MVNISSQIKNEKLRASTLRKEVLKELRDLKTLRTYHEKTIDDLRKDIKDIVKHVPKWFFLIVLDKLRIVKLRG